MKTKEIKQKSEKELWIMLAENRERLRQLKFDLINKKIKNIREIGQTKKLIAKILTIINEHKYKSLQ